MNKEFQELNKKSNEEICALIVKLKSQLLESRFKMAMGEVSKTHVLPNIRNTIARCMYIIYTRGFKVTTGTHGIYLIDIKTNKITDLTKKVQAALRNEEVAAEKADAAKKAKTAEETKKRAEEKARKGKLTENVSAKAEPAKEQKPAKTTKVDKAKKEAK